MQLTGKTLKASDSTLNVKLSHFKVLSQNVGII